MSKEEPKVTLPIDDFHRMDKKAQLLDQLVWDDKVVLDDLKIYEDVTDHEILIEELYPF